MMPGPVELIVIAVIAVLIFGKRLPGLARSIGTSFVEFRRGLSEPVEDFKSEAEEIRRGLRE